MKYISEQIYHITFRPKNASFERNESFIADSIEEAISMCKDCNQECIIIDVRRGTTAKRKTIKTITVDL